MDDRRPATEKQPVSTHTTVNTTKEARGGGVTVFILGGLVVAVLGIGYFLFSNGSFGGAGTPESGGDVSISVETGGAGEAAAPAAAPDTPAASETADPAPAD